MKDNLQPRTTAWAQHLNTNGLRVLLLWTGAVICLFTQLSAQAGSFFSDFNSGLPASAAVYGVATNDTIGGFTNSGCLKLTTANNSIQGAFVITNDLDAGQTVVGFTASFKAYVGGGTSADGFSFNFASDLLSANGNFSEEGGGTGLTIEFDTYSNAPPAADSIGIGIKLNGSEYFTSYFSRIRAGTWADVFIQASPDGNISVMYDGNWIFTNAYIGPLSIAGGHFGLGARTGGANDNHWIDNLSIKTETIGSPYVAYFWPVGRSVRGDAPIDIILTDAATQVDASKIALQLDGNVVVPTITQAGGNTTLRYLAPAVFASGSTHSVNLVYADNATPTPFTNNLPYEFSVAAYGALATNLVAAPSRVSTNPGFSLRISQIDANLGPTLQRAENQLANLYIDPTTSLPYVNLASLSTYVETGVMNYSLFQDDQGNFPSDTPLPGIPGTTGGTTNIAMDAVAYLYLTSGMHTFGVNSADGFKLTVADSPDLFATPEAVYNGVRTAGDTTIIFAVAQAGYYPFRVLFLVGGLEAVNPGATDPSLEFFSLNADGVKTLINDPNTPGSIKAYLPAETLPYIRSVSPGVGENGVAGNASVNAVLVDGTITVQTNTLQLQINDTVVTPTLTANAGVTTVRCQPATVLTPNSTNTVQIAFTDSASHRRTNSYQFYVANILTPLWTIPPGDSATPWLTTGSTERGLAYNPKTGHVILVSRAGSLNVVVLDGNNGSFLRLMNIGDLVQGTSPGTFALNMVDVADDGVIYIANLTTSGTVPFIIYRWQDENSAPTIAYSDNPASLTGAVRCGDDFRVRGSGAGTQIIASGNSAVTNVPIFTTIDGINFTGTSLQVKNLAANSVRLGLAFGCGNTFYGETTATPMSYVGFDGPPSSAASLLSTHTIYSSLGSANIGPIGVDLVNQRLIANGTIGGSTANPHSMNLFDLTALSTTGVNNPIDSKTFASANGNFGTGSIDFTPDGTRLYTLDTGNGIIAFNLAPKLAAPTICAHPQNFIIPSLGMVGFMDVSAIGSPQYSQWRFNGQNLANATNRTLDIPNVQLSQLGRYSVVITNSMGSVTSLVAMLDIPMESSSQPANQIIAVGGTTTLNANVTSGLPPYTYQWALNGANLAGAVNSTLTLLNAQPTNAGSYSVTVADSPGQTMTFSLGVVTVGSIGAGTGLMGDYYGDHTNDLNNFTGLPTLSRVDPTIDFDWGTTSSPDPGILPDYYLVRWHGQVQPLYSQTYTLYIRSDDGARLWVNGQLLVDAWKLQSPTEYSGTIPLVANQKYDLLMEYYENASGAVAQLSWSSPNQVKEIIPMTQLYPGAAGFVQPILTPSLANGTNLLLNWSGTFRLESAFNVLGSWAPVAGGTLTSPYSNNIGTAPQMFFRLLYPMVP